MLCHYVQSIADVLPWLFRHHKLSLLRLILGLAFFNCAFKKQFFFFFFATHFGPSLIVFCFLLLFLFFNNITFNFFIIIIFLLSVTHLHKNYIF